MATDTLRVAAASSMRQPAAKVTRPSTSCSTRADTSAQRRPRTPGRSVKKNTLNEPQDHEEEKEDDEALVFRPTPLAATNLRPRATQHDITSRVASLLDSAEQKLREQLLIASEKGKRHAVYLLLHQRVLDRDRCRGMRGYTPLHHAATRGHLDVLQLFVEFGWSVDGVNDALETPLHLASFGGHAAVVEFLLDKGADANALSVDGETPLFYAARKNHYRVVCLLLRRECDLTITNRYGDVAEDEASSEKTLQEFATGREDLERLYRRTKPASKSTKPSKSPVAAFRGEVTLMQKQREDVLAFLDLKSLCRASQVCYRWHRASDTPSLWRRLGVSRWELQLQTSVGMGAVAPMALFSGSGRLQLNMAGLVGSVTKSSSIRRPSSCDSSTATGALIGTAGGGSRFLGDHRRPQTARRPTLL